MGSLKYRRRPTTIILPTAVPLILPPFAPIIQVRKTCPATMATTRIARLQRRRL
jgi:hypothetical protein